MDYNTILSANEGESSCLQTSPVVNFDDPAVAACARTLADNAIDKEEVIRSCFTWVRDEIGHSADIGASAVTCTASEVLAHGTGICFAKSHLLAALLRANGIPTGFCYQRLSIAGNPEGPHSLHGFNTVWLNGGWFRIDARGNRQDVDAQFTPPVERLAFPVRKECGEFDIPGVFAEPLPAVVQALSSASSFAELWANLPDYERSEE